MPLKRTYLSLGSNLGEREENLGRALRALERDHIHVFAQSSIYETEPQDVVQQGWFLNLAVECETRCFPLQLLGVTERIERELGRERGAGGVPRGPRVIDIDVLLFGNVVMATPQLTIPHPRMLERRFVLEPLLEIAPELRHPGTREPLSKYLGKLEGQKVRRL
ncbi:MAG: 2-amino-4-hydroxy-6-hydroxymethyldihydropteridine diphosphokinase [Bryobacteraceae bacterium]